MDGFLTVGIPVKEFAKGGLPLHLFLTFTLTKFQEKFPTKRRSVISELIKLMYMLTLTILSSYLLP